jgi:hypothetical protein
MPSSMTKPKQRARLDLTFVCSNCGPEAEADVNGKCVRCLERGMNKDCIIKRVKIYAGGRVEYLPLSKKIRRML